MQPWSCSKKHWWGQPPSPLPCLGTSAAHFPAWGILTSPSVVFMSSTVGS